MGALAEASKAEKTRSGIFKLLSQVLTGDLPNRGDDRNAPRRVPRTSLARCRLDGKEDPRAPQLHPRPLVDAEVPQRRTLGAPL
jgi:hypothetical protein